MGQQVYRSIDDEIRKDPSFAEGWESDDRGLITCWEVGRKLRRLKPELELKAKQGQLPKLGWKGGIQFPPPKKFAERKEQKYGTLNYLAQWQGLRGDDLDIDLSKEREIVCSLTGIRVIFTGDLSKFREIESDETEESLRLLK